MLGTGAHRPTVAFLGWFGPRGLASIVFAAIVVQEADLPHASTIVLTTYATVGLSVLAHGVTAAPFARRYAAWFASHPPEARPAMESVPAGTHRWRRAHRSPVT
jgi:NhaP-type Na+/H+ or K+/H+ antiporter